MIEPNPTHLLTHAEAEALLTPWAALAPELGWALADPQQRVLAQLGAWPVAQEAQLFAAPETEMWALQAGEQWVGVLWTHGPAASRTRFGPAAQQTLTQFFANALERRQLAAEALERYREINLIYRLSDTLSGARQSRLVGERVLAECRRVLRAASGALFLQAPAGLQVVASFDQSLAQTGAALFAAVVSVSPELNQPALLTELPPPVATDWQTALWVPLNAPAGWLGGLALGRVRGGAPFVASDQKLLLTIANQTALALENAQLFEDLQQAFDQTLAIKNLLGDTFASITSAIITIDRQHTITTFNRAAEGLLALPAAQAVGAVLPQVVGEVWPLTWQAIVQDRPTPLEEITLTERQTQPVHVLATAAPLRDGRGQPMGAVLVLNDLTREKQLEAEREQIRQTFGRVVAPRVRDRLLSDPGSLSLSGARQNITVLFADLHQFTAFSEVTPPEMLLRVLNGHLALAAQAVLAEEGTLDKFIGDAVMAFWNAPDAQPDHALRAVRAAWRLMRLLAHYHAPLDPSQRLVFSVGLAEGEAMVGNVGTRDLFNYTVIGDTVNLAQRLEDLAQPGQILLSATMYRSVAGQVQARALPELRVKGRQQLETAYELLGVTGLELAPEASP